MDRRKFLRSSLPGALGTFGALATFSAAGRAAPAPAGVADAAKPDGRGGRAPRVVVLDWGLVETLLALGVTPAGIAETDAYNTSVVTPAVPSGVPDVGLRLSPNLELLQQLAPDFIAINSSQESQRAMLERIAPVRAFAIYTDAGAPYRRAQQVTRELAALCGCERAAETLIARTSQALDASRARLAVALPRRRPLYLIRFFDGRHIGVYGARSLFEDVFDTLGLANAWDGPTDYWGIGVAPLEKLAAVPQASVLYFEPLPPGVARTLASNRLWHALPAVAGGRVAALPPFWGFGMLPSAQRFSEALTRVLLDGPPALAASAAWAGSGAPRVPAAGAGRS